jgi:hypothetical protein
MLAAAAVDAGGAKTFAAEEPGKAGAATGEEGVTIRVR